MGLEFKLETYDALRANIPDFVKHLSEFHREIDGRLELSLDGTSIIATVYEKDGDVFLTRTSRAERAMQFSVC